MDDVIKITRRSFLKGVAGTGLLIGLGPTVSRMLLAAEGGTSAAGFQPNVYISIGTDGAIKLICHRSEMGQGVRTSVLMMLAEELEVGLDQVELVQSVGDKKYGDQNTDGSTTIRMNWIPKK